MAWAQVQKVVGANDVNALTVTSTGTGNLIVVACAFSGTGFTVSSITDNAAGGSNTYVSASCRSTNLTTENCEIWYVASSKSGATTVTINLSSSSSTESYTFYEISGMDKTSPLEIVGVLSSQGANTNPVSPAITTVSPGTFIVAAAFDAGAISAMHAGNEFTNDSLINGNAAAHITSTSATAASHQAQWDSTSSTYCSSIAAFRLAGLRNLADDFAVRRFGPT